MVEFAVDFKVGSNVDRQFVLRHGIFGRSRLIDGRLYEDVRSGTRRSSTMTRGYHKSEIDAYRLEIELHSAWLRSNGIRNPEDLSSLPHLLMPSRLWFVRIDWGSLKARLSRKGLPVGRILCRTRSKASCLSRTLEYLRVDVGLSNVHRFLRPLKINNVIQQELKVWADRWQGATNV
jgi:hypothetical protein